MQHALDFVEAQGEKYDAVCLLQVILAAIPNILHVTQAQQQHARDFSVTGV